MPESKIPQPGPAKLKRNAGPDEWLEAAKDCKYLSEPHMKQLCEIVKEYMMEGKCILVWTRFIYSDPVGRIQYPASIDTCHSLW
jgi:hypothetical protein